MGKLVDKKLTNSYRNMSCIVCESVYQIVAHHIKTRGSGEGDYKENLIPVCFTCHRLFNDKGLVYMAEKHGEVSDFLINNGYEFDNFSQKWISLFKE